MSKFFLIFLILHSLAMAIYPAQQFNFFKKSQPTFQPFIDYANMLGFVSRWDFFFNFSNDYSVVEYASQSKLISAEPWQRLPKIPSNYLEKMKMYRLTAYYFLAVDLNSNDSYAAKILCGLYPKEKFFLLRAASARLNRSSSLENSAVIYKKCEDGP